MLQWMFLVEILLMLGFPVALWLVLWRRFGATWGLIVAGVVTFVASQVIHIPLLLGLTQWANQPGLWPFGVDSPMTFLTNAVVLGLAAGVCEESARYLVLRYWRREARTWIHGITFGAGHGGIESILLGVQVLVGLVSMVAMRGMDLEAMGLSGEMLTEAQAQVAAFWSTAWYLPLLGAAERIFAITLHVSWSLLVVRALTRNNLGWLVVAILGHAFVDGVAVWLTQVGWAPLAIEGVLFLFTLGAVAVIWALRSSTGGEAQLDQAGDVSRET